MLPNRSHAVVVQSRDAIEYEAGVRLATVGGTIAFGGLPTNTETVTIGANTYTFLDTLVGAANEVLIVALDRDATMANLVTAINVNAPTLVDANGRTITDPAQGITATLVVVAGADNDTLTLSPSLEGASGNTTLAEASAAITVVSLSGGTDLNDVTQEAIMTAVEALAAEISAAGLKVDIADSITLDVDLVIADVEAITGSGASAADLFDIYTALGAATPHLYSAAASESVADLLFDGTTSAVDHLATIASMDFATETTLDDVLDQLDGTTTGNLKSTNDGYGLADYFDTTNTYPPLYDSNANTPLADLLYSSGSSNSVAELLDDAESGYLYSIAGSMDYLVSSSSSKSVAELLDDAESGYLYSIADSMSYLVSSNDEYGLADYFDSSNAYPPLYSPNDGYGLAEYFDSGCVLPPFYDTDDGTGLADIVDSIDGKMGGDAVLGMQATIDAFHHEIHEEEAFVAFKAETLTNIGEFIAIAFITPSGTNQVHLTTAGSSTGKAKIGLYESPTIDVDEGTQIAPLNRWRDSTNDSILTSVKTAPTANEVTTYTTAQSVDANISRTTVLEEQTIGDSGGPQGSGSGNIGGRQEWVLAPATQYVMVIETLTNDDNYVSLNPSWYEHDSA